MDGWMDGWMDGYLNAYLSTPYAKLQVLLAKALHEVSDRPGEGIEQKFLRHLLHQSIILIFRASEYLRF